MTLMAAITAAVTTPSTPMVLAQGRPLNRKRRDGAIDVTLIELSRQYYTCIVLNR
jgi:hypothetical protein